jgi:RecJ-like exonuclease
MYDPIMDLSQDNCGKTVKCPECDGAGQILVMHEVPEHGCHGDEKLCATLCPVRGYVEDYEVCPTCHGEKEITR